MGDDYDPEHDQPLPTPNSRQAIHDMVIRDLVLRKRHGTIKYGTPLQPHNGRNALLDAYCEALDLVCYLKKALVEEGVYSIPGSKNQEPAESLYPKDDGVYPPPTEEEILIYMQEHDRDQLIERGMDPHEADRVVYGEDLG